MKDSFSSNGARDRPVLLDEEKISLSKDRRIANRARAEAGIEDTAFRQADKASSFASREETFSAEMNTAEQAVSKTSTAQKERIRRSYAKDVRNDLGTDNTVDSFGEGGIRTKAEGRAGSLFQKNRTQSGAASGGQFFSEENLPKSSAFYVGEEPAAAGKISGKHLAGKRFRRTAEIGAEGVRSTLGDAVMPDQEGEGVSSGVTRTGYGAARLGTAGAEKGVKRLIGPKTASRADAHFATEKASSIGRNAAVRGKASAFYAGEESIAAGEAARQKAARAFQRRLIRKNYQTAPESAVYIPIVSRIRERARRRSGQAAAAGTKTAAKKIAEFFEQHPMLLIIILLSGILVMLVGAAISGGTMLMTHTVAPSTLATTYTAENSDIKGAENDYRALEAELSTKVNDLESN